MRSSASSTLAPSDSPPDCLAPPSPLGLFALGTTLAILILQTRGWLNLEAWLLVVLILYGSSAMILIGLSEWRQQSQFGAVAYICAGLFCLSKIALEILPRYGFGNFPSAASMAAYLGLWALFGSVLCFGARPLALAVQGVFLLLTLHLTLHSFALALSRPLLSLSADLLGLAAAACAGYCSLAICLNASRGRIVLPLGCLPPGTKAAAPEK